jgi:hypothetical protein
MLSDETISGYDRLSFAPAMLYYLMGFKDVLASLAVANVRNEIDKKINAYCVEDAEHWRWYLDDLGKLGYSLDSWGKTIPEFCNEVWSPTTEINRKTIFALIHYSKLATDPLLKLVLIQVFEATGVVFIGHTRKAAMAMGHDDTLLYFGKTHYEEEFGHSVQSQDIMKFQLENGTFDMAVTAVEELFICFGEMFDCWYSHRERFPSHKQDSVASRK